MNFPYLSYLAQDNGTQTQLYRPVIPVDLARPSGELDFYGLVNTGSDDTLISRFLAKELGLEIDDSQTSNVRGIAEEIVTIASAVVELRIADETEFASWEASVGVIGVEEEEHDFVILGHSACLDFFTATFDGDRRALEMFPNPNFPGFTGRWENGSPK